MRGCQDEIQRKDMLGGIGDGVVKGRCYRDAAMLCLARIN